MITPRATLLLVAVLVGGACSTDGVRTPLTPLAGAGNDSRPILTRLQAGETAVVDHASIGCWSRRRARIVFTGGSPVVIPWTELDFSSEEPLETRRGSLTHHDASRLDATVRWYRHHPGHYATLMHYVTIRIFRDGELISQESYESGYGWVLSDFNNWWERYMTFSELPEHLRGHHYATHSTGEDAAMDSASNPPGRATAGWPQASSSSASRHAASQGRRRDAGL